ncbi:MAG: hypothetical protein IJZ03_07835 [Clostridia bacterium]|nr:hypothetical protein [Clostridia bacterium]
MPVDVHMKIDKHTLNRRHLTYTLIKGMLESRESYSVEISMAYEGNFESALARDVSDDVTACERLLRLLSDMEVEPCHLYDILEDILPI